MTQNAVNLYDRVKELSYTTGTNDFELSGASAGFSTFSRFYSHNDIIFYAITDGTFYEVGSGIFKREDYSGVDNIHVDTIVRNPFRSSNLDNSKVNFPAGTKEVYITYPATHSVIMGSGLSGGLNTPQRHGIAVWDSENILNYFSNFVFTENGGLGINNSNPLYGIDLGGDAQDYSSRVRASGYYVGPTGVYFQANTTGANSNDVGLNTDAYPYAGGRQFVHFKPNLTDAGITPTTNSHLVFDVSGVVNEYLLLKKQPAGQVFAGPLTSCGSPPCDADYPSFRPLGSGDLPLSELDTLYTTNIQLAITSGDLASYTDSEILSASGALNSSISGVQDNLDIHVSGYASDLRDLEVAISGKLDTYLHQVDHEHPYVTAYIDRSNQFGHEDNSTYWTDSQWSIVPFADVEYQSSDSSWDTSSYWYDVPMSGRYNVQVNLSSFYDDDASPAHGDTVYRLATSGNNTVSYSYTNGYAIPANPLTIDGGSNYISYNSVKSHSWNISVPSGHKIFLEYGGFLYNMSNISIHKI